MPAAEMQQESAANGSVPVPHRIRGQLAGQVRRISLPAIRPNPGMDLDQLTPEAELHRLRVDAGGQALSDEITGNAVESLADLNVPIRATFGFTQVGMSNAVSGNGFSF